MYNHATTLTKAGMAAMFSFLLLGSISVSAQKSVYDVIPGSGPKKQKEVTKKTSLPDIIRGDSKKGNDNDEGRDDREYSTKERKHLPPGQAKKIYGGSAKDYAPGQMKKRKHGKHYKHGKHHKD